MELYTGAARSVISKNTFDRLFPGKSKPVFTKEKVSLKVYGGDQLNIVGEMSVDIQVVSSGVLAKACRVVVVDGVGPSLLGRDLLGKLELGDLKLSEIHSVSDNTTLAEKFPSLFFSRARLFQEPSSQNSS